MTTPRYRFRDTRTDSHTRTVNRDGAGNLQDDTQGVNERKARGSFKSISDVYDPSYFDRRNNGEVVLHPVVIVTDDRSTVPSSFFVGPHPVWGSRHITGDVASITNLTPSGSGVIGFQDNIETAKDLALIEAYAKMNSPDVLLSVFYAERGKTAAMLRKPFEGARSLTEKILFRKAKLASRGFTAARALAQAWLEYRFGWRPLIQDISGIAKAAGHAKPEAGKLLVKRGGRDISYQEDGHAVVNYPGLTSLELRYNWDFTAQIRSGVLYRYRDLSEAAWKMRCLGLTADQIPQHLWEVTSWSFVWDYFQKVGMWLQAITPNPDVIVEGNWVSVKSTNINTNDCVDARTYVTQSPPTDYHTAGGSYTEKLGRFERSVNRSLPTIPPMEVNPLSFSQHVDLAALLLGQVHTNLRRLRF